MDIYNNIGGKIKVLAKVLAWIGIIACFIFGVVLIASSEDAVVLGFFIMIFGALLSWVSSFVLYGFGELVENSELLVLSKEKPIIFLMKETILKITFTRMIHLTNGVAPVWQYDQ